MGKLVRDRIPEIIEADGRTATIRVLDSAEFETALLDKLIEEAEELRQAPAARRLEEAADVYEVLLTVAMTLGVTLDDVAELAARKRQERGGFTARIWLDC